MKTNPHPRDKGRQPRSFFFVKDVPADLKHQFKAYCALQGESMSHTIIRLVKQALAKQERK